MEAVAVAKGNLIFITDTKRYNDSMSVDPLY